MGCALRGGPRSRSRCLRLLERVLVPSLTMQDSQILPRLGLWSPNTATVLERPPSSGRPWTDTSLPPHHAPGPVTLVRLPFHLRIPVSSTFTQGGVPFLSKSFQKDRLGSAWAPPQASCQLGTENKSPGGPGPS